jgi:hypothetical protein
VDFLFFPPPQLAAITTSAIDHQGVFGGQKLGYFAVVE